MNLPPRLQSSLRLTVSQLADARKGIGAALPIAFALIVLWQGLPAVRAGYRFPNTQDFYFLYDAGQIIRDHASSLYLDINKPGVVVPLIDYDFPDWYPYPPAVAMLTRILAFLAVNQAVFAMRVLISLATLYIALKVSRSFEAMPWRLAMFAAVVCWEPILLNAKIGQTGVFVAALIALGADLYAQGKPIGAAVFGLVALKPTAAIGPALAVAVSKPRLWVYFWGVGFVVVFVPFVLLGREALEGWLRILYERSTVDLGGGNHYNQGLSSMVSFRGIVGATLLVIAAGAVWLSALRVKTRLGLEAATAYTILMGFLLNPHSLLYDWGIAFVAIFLLRRSTLIRAEYADLGIGLLGVSLFLVGQWTWRSSIGTPMVNPLTAWALAVNLGLLGLSLHPRFVRSPERLPAPATV